MKVKKVVGLLLGFTLVCQSLFFTTASVSADETGELSGLKNELVNVARGKQGSVFNLFANTPDLTRLTDGDTAFNTVNGVYNAMGSYPNDYAYFQVDLKNRYLVSSVNLYSFNVGTVDNVKKQFRIIGSNNESFEEYYVLYDASESDFTESWINGEAFTVTIPEENQKAVRYIRYQKSVKGVACGMAEFEAYANQTVTDVALQKTASTNRVYLSMAADKAVNGTNANESDCWFANIGSADIYAYLLVDLGAAFPLERVEIEGRNVAEATSNGHRKNLDVYLAEQEFAEAVLNDAENAHLSESEDYDCLVKIGAGSGEMIPPYDTKAGQTGCKTINIPDEYAGKRYRYVLIRKSTKNEGASVGQLRVYAINPVLNHFSVDKGVVTLEFSNPMNITENDKIVTNKLDGKMYAATKLDDYTYRFEMRDEGEYEISVNGLTDIYGMPCYSENIVVPFHYVSDFAFINQKTADGNETVLDSDSDLTSLSVIGAKASVTNIGGNAENPVIIVALYDKATNALLNAAAESLPSVIENGASAVMSTGLDIPTEGKCYAKVFMWNGFEILKPLMPEKRMD